LRVERSTLGVDPGRHSKEVTVGTTE